MFTSDTVPGLEIRHDLAQVGLVCFKGGGEPSFPRQKDEKVLIDARACRYTPIIIYITGRVGRVLGVVAGGSRRAAAGGGAGYPSLIPLPPLPLIFTLCLHRSF